MIPANTTGTRLTSGPQVTSAAECGVVQDPLLTMSIKDLLTLKRAAELLLPTLAGIGQHRDCPVLE